MVRPLCAGLTAFLSLAACRDPIDTIANLRVAFRIEPNVVWAGDSMTARLVIVNPASNDIRVRSGSSCVATLDAISNDQRVDLEGTAFGCFDVVSTFVVPAHDSLVNSFRLVAMFMEKQKPWQYVVPPPPGVYQLRARMQVRLPDPTVTFTVAP